jgi:transposase InsO family protein
MNDDPHSDRWARLRFAIIGPLLAAPPSPGELRQSLETLAAQTWKHPIEGTVLRFGFATVERWYYLARSADDPVAALRRLRRNDAGRARRLSCALVDEIESLYRKHPGWTVQLHYDNLRVLCEQQAPLGPLPSYATVRRHLKARGYHRKRTPKRQTPGAQQAQERLERLEVRSYESDHTHSLWHADFHHGSLRVLDAAGQWITPLLLGIIDDHSRLICHLQWYLDETAESLVHGLCQGLQKRALPRALMTDNGAAMKADEFLSGLHTLGIVFEPTLPYSPWQNAKQESFWATLEGRLMAMLEGVSNLSLDRLNEITQVWVEHDYHRKRHSEIAMTPMQRYLEAPNVGRECPDSRRLRQAFRGTVTRRQRRSDGTVSLHGKRFEIPGRYRHLERPRLRYARWDLSAVELLDPHNPIALCPLYPVDKSANASGQRRALEPIEPVLSSPSPESTDELPPLMRQMMADYAATGQPPAYLPKPAPESNR